MHLASKAPKLRLAIANVLTKRIRYNSTRMCSSPKDNFDKAGARAQLARLPRRIVGHGRDGQLKIIAYFEYTFIILRVFKLFVAKINFVTTIERNVPLLPLLTRRLMSTPSFECSTVEETIDRLVMYLSERLIRECFRMPTTTPLEITIEIKVRCQNHVDQQNDDKT